MFFLLKSEKWAPYRDNWIVVHKTRATSALFGFLTVIMMPTLFWIARRGENVIQFWSGARKLANFSSDDDPDCHSYFFLESIVSIPQQCQISSDSKGLKQKLKILTGFVLSKINFLVLFCWIYGFDQIWSDGFTCRNLKDGAGFLLSNDTPPADYLNATFTKISDMRQENAEGVFWYYDKVNGLLTEHLNLINQRFHGLKLSIMFSKTADLIESFNFLGFHDVCNVLTFSDLDDNLPPWFHRRNATGRFYIYSIKFADQL